MGNYYEHPRIGQGYIIKDGLIGYRRVVEHRQKANRLGR